MTGRRGILLALIALVAILIIDVFTVPMRYPLPKDPVIARDLIQASESLTPPRAHSVIVALAAREMLQGGATLVVPGEVEELLEIPGADVGSAYPATLNPSLMRPLLGDRVVLGDYDPELDADTVARLLEGGTLVEHDRDVYAAMPGDDDTAYAVYVDPSHTQVFLIPVTDEVDLR